MSVIEEVVPTEQKKMDQEDYDRIVNRNFGVQTNEERNIKIGEEIRRKKEIETNKKRESEASLYKFQKKQREIEEVRKEIQTTEKRKAIEGYVSLGLRDFSFYHPVDLTEVLVRKIEKSGHDITQGDYQEIENEIRRQINTPENVELRSKITDKLFTESHAKYKEEGGTRSLLKIFKEKLADQGLELPMSEKEKYMDRLDQTLNLKANKPSFWNRIGVKIVNWFK